MKILLKLTEKLILGSNYSIAIAFIGMEIFSGIFRKMVSYVQTLQENLMLRIAYYTYVFLI